MANKHNYEVDLSDFENPFSLVREFMRHVRALQETLGEGYDVRMCVDGGCDKIDIQPNSSIRDILSIIPNSGTFQMIFSPQKNGSSESANISFNLFSLRMSVNFEGPDAQERQATFVSKLTAQV